jgi:hypothetical protein
VPLLALPFVLERPSGVRWSVFFALLGALFVWRLDNGFATALASGAVLLAWPALDPGFRPRPSALLRAMLSVLAAYALVFFVLSWWRGVDPSARLVDLWHIVNSSQGFGGSKIAPRREPYQNVHLFLMPALVLAVAGWVWVRRRRELDAAHPARGAALVVLYLAAYYFANYPRGLVRHTFYELGNVYLQSFSFAVLALAVYALSSLGATARAALFLGTATLLGSSFHLEGPMPESAGAFQPLLHKVERHMRDYPRLPHTDQPIDRSPIWPYLIERHYGAVDAFVKRQLAPRETFLDLAYSPMLYVYTHRRSPHYLNHLFLAHDDWLNKRAVEEFSQQRSRSSSWPPSRTWPCATRPSRCSTRHDQRPAAQLPLLRVDLAALRAVVHRAALAGLEAQGLGRPAAPGGTQARSLVRLAGPLSADGELRWSATQSQEVVLERARPAHLALRGPARAGDALVLRLRLARGSTEQRFERRIVLAEGSERFFCLPAEVHGAELLELELDARAAPGLRLSEAELVEQLDPDRTQCWQRAEQPPNADLRRIPWYWANYDAQDALERPCCAACASAPRTCKWPSARWRSSRAR